MSEHHVTGALVPFNYGEAYLYLAEIEGVGVKVGISTSPMRRLSNHSRDAAAYGRRVDRTWISPVPHANARKNEAAIKGSSKREYLNRSFDDCLAQAEALPFLRAPESSPLDSPTNKFLSSMFPGYGEWLAKECNR